MTAMPGITGNDNQQIDMIWVEQTNINSRYYSFTFTFKLRKRIPLFVAISGRKIVTIVYVRIDKKIGLFVNIPLLTTAITLMFFFTQVTGSKNKV